MIEAYCVRDRQTVEMEEPEPVWTRRGMPATRGICPECGGTVFRMGKSEAHDDLKRPAAIQVADGTKRGKMPFNSVYINYTEADSAIAEQLADDLKKLGIAAWLHEPDAGAVNWAGGVHPALKECNRMVYVLSPAMLGDGESESAWRFFREKRKPIVIAQIDSADPPDDIRRSPRFDLAGDYKMAFRQMIQVLSE